MTDDEALQAALAPTSDDDAVSDETLKKLEEAHAKGRQQRRIFEAGMPRPLSFPSILIR